MINEEYIRLSDLPEKERESFSKFVAYKNHPLLYDNGYIEDAYFLTDYRAWLNEQM